MSVSEQDARHMIETLDRVHGQLKTLREERERLMESNRKLVDLVEQLEDALRTMEEKSGYSQPGDEHEYDFQSGWRTDDEGHRDALEISSDVGIDEIERQIGEIRQTLSALEKFKN